jgi:hypothetical protein
MRQSKGGGVATLASDTYRSNLRHEKSASVDYRHLLSPIVAQAARSILYSCRDIAEAISRSRFDISRADNNML